MNGSPQGSCSSLSAALCGPSARLRRDRRPGTIFSHGGTRPAIQPGRKNRPSYPHNPRTPPVEMWKPAAPLLKLTALIHSTPKTISWSVIAPPETPTTLGKCLIRGNGRARKNELSKKLLMGAPRSHKVVDRCRRVIIIREPGRRRPRGMCCGIA
jgi:hypothetical protein